MIFSSKVHLFSIKHTLSSLLVAYYDRVIVQVLEILESSWNSSLLFQGLERQTDRYIYSTK